MKLAPRSACELVNSQFEQVAEEMRGIFFPDDSVRHTPLPLKDKIIEDLAGSANIPAYFDPRLVIVPELPFEQFMRAIIINRGRMSNSFGNCPKLFPIQTSNGHPLALDIDSVAPDLDASNELISRIERWKAFFFDASPRPEIRQYYGVSKMSSADFLKQVAKCHPSGGLEIMDAKTYVMMQYLLRANDSNNIMPDLKSATFAYADMVDGTSHPLAISSEYRPGTITAESIKGINYIRNQNQGGVRLVIPIPFKSR